MEITRVDRNISYEKAVLRLLDTRAADRAMSENDVYCDTVEAAQAFMTSELLASKNNTLY